MRWDSVNPEVPNVDGTPGAAVVVKEAKLKAVQVVGYTAGEWEIEGSVDGTHFGKLGASLTADGVVERTEAVQLLRINCKTAAVLPNTPPVIALGLLFDRD